MIKERKNLVSIALEMSEYRGKEVPSATLAYWERAIFDLLRETNPHYSNDSRLPPQVHFRVNVSGLKRVPDATFTIDGDIRDVDMDDFWKQRDAFQQEVDKRFPLETLAHFADPPVPEIPPGPEVPLRAGYP